MRIVLIVWLALLGLAACQPARQLAARQPLPASRPQAEAVEPPARGAQAQMPVHDDQLPVFKAAETLPAPSRPVADAVASTARQAAQPEWKKPLGLSRMVLKAVEKQTARTVKAIQKRRPADNLTILGLRPVLFFSLLAVAVGVVLLFVAGKSQFFSILTVLLLIVGLLVSLAAFLEII